MLRLYICDFLDVASHRERAFSWGDGGFEELLHSLGRKRAMSEMSSDSDFNTRPAILAPIESPTDDRALRSVAFPPPPLPNAEQAAPMSSYQHFFNHGVQSQFPQRFQLLIQNNGFLTGHALTASGIVPTSMHVCRPEDMKVGAYTKLERQEKIAKYRAKKSQRVFRKQVKYDCRKKLADTRPRVKGRFVTKEETTILKEEADVGSGPVSEEPSDAIQADTSCESFI